ncbi:hypothetical protein D3C73_1508990 [compost metagenome]
MMIEPRPPLDGAMEEAMKLKHQEKEQKLLNNEFPRFFREVADLLIAVAIIGLIIYSARWW